MSDPLSERNSSPDPEARLIAAVRRGEETAWQELINQFEGRLSAYVRRRYSGGDGVEAVEDLVQETFLGFLTSLPNYRDGTPLESFLFSIAAHKIVDALRRSGRRPPLRGNRSGSGQNSIWGRMSAGVRGASSLMRSRDHQRTGAELVADELNGLLTECCESENWERIQVLDLVFGAGWRNQRVAEALALDEQTVANHRAFAVNRLRKTVPPALLTALGEPPSND